MTCPRHFTGARTPEEAQNVRSWTPPGGSLHPLHAQGNTLAISLNIIDQARFSPSLTLAYGVCAAGHPRHSSWTTGSEHLSHLL